MLPKTFRLPGKTEWLDTGIDLVSGQVVDIRAEGEVVWKKEGFGWCSPQGNTLYTRWGKRPVLGVGVGALIGRIGSSADNAFFIGNTFRMEASSSGRLFLGINDDNVTDNAGYFDIWIQTDKKVKVMKTPMNRRDFIMKSSLPVAFALILPSKIETISPAPCSGKNTYKCRMRVGSDTDKLPSSVKSKGAFTVLDYLKVRGFDGAFFRLMLELSPTLDPGGAQGSPGICGLTGMFLEAGIGWINLIIHPNGLRIRRFGKGDYRKAIEKMISAARLINCNELWAVSAHSIHGDPFYVAYDRFRTDVTWDDQIEAMIKFITMLAPLLKDLGCRLNLETHGDETSFEALRMIERLGPDILGVTLDTGNLPLQADLPFRCY